MGVGEGWGQGGCWGLDRTRHGTQVEVVIGEPGVWALELLGLEKAGPTRSWWPAETQEEGAGGTPSAPAGAAEPDLQEGALGSFFEHPDGDSPGGSTWIARPGREFWGSGAFRKC